jgi:hypothetical protein
MWLGLCETLGRGSDGSQHCIHIERLGDEGHGEL